MFYLAQTLEENLNLENLENPTIIEELVASFDWRSISKQLIVVGIRVLFTLLFFYIVNKIAKWLIENLFNRYLKSRSRLSNQKMSNRNETIYRVINNVYHSIFIFFLMYTLLEILSFPVGTLLASAGVVGLALSLGAQGFVSDLVNGMTILSERQLDIGDEVNIEEVSGTVMNINLRTTQVKDFDGTMHYIPNREIIIISNRSKGDMRALIDIYLFHDTDIDKVRTIIEQVNKEFVPKFPEITVPPKDILFVSNAKGQLNARIIMYTTPGDQYGVMNKFYEHYISALTKAGLDLPYGDFDIDLE